MDELGEEVYYILEESRYDDGELVRQVTDEEVENFEWFFVTSNGDENEG